VPIVLIGSSPLVLVANPGVPASSVKDLIAYARERPGQLNFGSFGIGSNSHLAAELFNSLANIQASHVPYRGSPQALNDLIGGRIQYTFDGVQTSLGFIQAGTIRLLAVAGPERSPLLPNAPTISESGIPGFDATLWSGLFAPAGTPKPVIELLNRKMDALLREPATKELFAKVGIEAKGGDASALAGRVESEMRKWVGIAREKNIRVEP
jgi:tripartite-type tricarboxylate transporter receptor subunit TctC